MSGSEVCADMGPCGEEQVACMEDDTCFAVVMALGTDDAVTADEAGPCIADTLCNAAMQCGCAEVDLPGESVVDKAERVTTCEALGFTVPSTPSKTSGASRAFSMAHLMLGSVRRLLPFVIVSCVARMI